MSDPTVANLNIAQVDFTNVSTVKKMLDQYDDTDTLIVDIWGPDIVQGLVEHAFNEQIDRDQANALLETVTEGFEQGFLPVNPEILTMVNDAINTSLEGIKNNAIEMSNEPQ
tara:strand:+ start:158 stop:493 length:336 start_codon:yes stop_codon:yes gene_type:complete